MPCSAKFTLLLMAALTCAPQGLAQDAVTQFRYFSTEMRDHLPSVSEAKEFYNAPDKDAALDTFIQRWFSEPDYQKRVARHFNDMFGVSPFYFLVDNVFDLIVYDSTPGNHSEAPADLVTPGVFYLANTVKPTCGGIVPNVQAWFSDTPIDICNSALSNSVSYNLDDGSTANDLNCNDSFGSNGIHNAACGCGPQQILCYPRTDKPKAIVGVAREWAERGLHAYNVGWTWSDLLGGELFYGDRWLYHHYLHTQKIAVTWRDPSLQELAFLKALPLNEKVAVAHPPGGAERAGLVTMPAFLTRFNNFRSRVRALSNQLLCKDIDASLNTDQYAQFLNPDVDSSHGGKAGCDSCHFGMDNQGSTLMNWSTDGYYQAWDLKSEVGHAFGLDGSGPRFLMAGYTDRADGFTECMAKKSWEDFSGASWEVLSSTEKAELTAQAAQGPREAIRGVLTSAAMRKLRASPNSTTTKTVEVKLDFTRDINPILVQSCGGTSCHSQGNGRPSQVFIGNEPIFKAAPAIRLANGSMPPAGSNDALNAEDRNKLLLFLAQ